VGGSRLFVMIYVQGLLYLAVTGMSELFPLLCARGVAEGGLGLQPSELGVALLPLSLMLFVMPLLYPRIERRAGHYGCFRCGACAITLAVLLMSSLASLRASSPALMWVGLCLTGVLRGITGPLIFSSTAVIFNDLLTVDIGYWNGLASAVSSLCRGLAPVVFGSLFAIVNASGARFPFDSHLPFLLIVFVVAVLVLLVGRDPKLGIGGSGSNKRRRRPRRVTSTLEMSAVIW